MGYWGKRNTFGKIIEVQTEAEADCGVMTVQEYHDWVQMSNDYYAMQQRVINAENAQAAAEVAKADAERALRKEQELRAGSIRALKNEEQEKVKAKRDLREVSGKHAAEVEELSKEIQELRLQNQYLEHLNDEVYRIMRERANAERGIVPKKDHNGYMAVFQRPYRQRFERPTGYRDNTETVYLDYWMTKFQTPWPPSFSRDFARECVEGDFSRFLKRELNFIYKECGLQFEVQPLSERFWKIEEEQIDEFIRKRHKEEDDKYGYVMSYLPGSSELKKLWDEYNEEKQCQNCVYHVSYEQNIRAGYWEIVLYHTKEFEFPQQYIRGGYKPQFRKKKKTNQDE